MKHLHLVVVSAGILGVGPTVAAGEWTTYQHDIHRTGRSHLEIDPLELRPAWSAPAGFAAPLVTDHKIIATRTDVSYGSPALAAFDLESGDLTWGWSSDQAVPGLAGMGEGLVVWPGTRFSRDPDGVLRSRKEADVFDVVTGELLYRVDGLNGAGGGQPLVLDEGEGNIRAYYAAEGWMMALDLTRSSGSIAWQNWDVFGSLPTIAGESVIGAGPGRFSAFDRDTGDKNVFFSAGSGGGGTTPVFDASRSRLYVSEGRRTSTIGLIAFDYTDQDTITERWRYSGLGTDQQGSVAIDALGRVYTTDRERLVVLDPDSGEVLDLVEGLSLVEDNTPVLTANHVWLAGNSSTLVLSLADLELVATLPVGRNISTTVLGAGVPFELEDGRAGFIIERGERVERPGFDVYIVPEPSALVWIGASLALLVRPRRP